MNELERAIGLFGAGRLDEARRTCRKAIERQPDLPEGHLVMAEIQRALGDKARAEEAEARVLRLQPDWTRAYLAAVLGGLCEKLARRAEAEARYRSALELDPGLAEAREGLARVLFGARRFDEVEALCHEGLRRFPQAAFYPERLAYVAWHRGRHEEALAGLAQAMARAVTEEERQSVGASQALVLLALGRYAEGWRAFRWRHSRSALREQGVPLMPDPERLATLASPAHILVCEEQGLGDEIFFLRFAAALHERGHRVSFRGDARLAPLLPAFVESSSASAQYVIGSGDLPLAAGRDFAPPQELAVDPARRAGWERELRKFGPPPYIGVTWRAGVLPDEPKPQRGAYLVKEVASEALGQALAPAQASIVILQRRPTVEDLRSFTAGLGRPALDLSRTNDDLADALALLSLLEDYIGVSNTNMHLRAGLQGRLARVLLGLPSEWRWGLEGPRSPWFPDFALYRRRFDEDWTAVLQALKQDLAREYAAPHKE